MIIIIVIIIIIIIIIIVIIIITPLYPLEYQQQKVSLNIKNLLEDSSSV